MIETGKVLQNRYRIDKQIGQGGMGAVYVATDERFGSTVAIKETLCMDDNYRKAIEREARLLNSLKHTALPRVSDHFLEENGQFLVMEYIPGEDLFDMMEGRKTPFPVGDILNWADQLLDALDFLHNQDIPVIHRDIKPQNLKITARGQIILLDFGLAKGNPTDAEHNTAAKSIFGYSRNYASLEQIQGTGTDPRSDLYSLSATLYHLITATPPEDALTRAMSVLSQKPDPLIPANRVNAEVPRGVAEVLYRSMDLNAAGRPGSAADMRRMLRDCDKSIVPGDEETLVTLLDTGLLAQETRLMGGETVQDGNKLTDVKTEILPTNDSAETAVRKGLAGIPNRTGIAAGIRATTNPERPRGRKGMAVAAGLLLATVACAASLYVYNPAIFGGTSSQVLPGTMDISNAANSNAAQDAAANVNFNSAPIDTRAGTTTEEKPPETTKNHKAASPTKQGEDTDKMEVNDEGDVRVGDVVIRGDGRVETPDSVIDENGVRAKHPKRPPPGDPNFRPIPSEELEKLTPEQRRKLKVVLRNLPKPPPDAPRPRPRENPDNR